MSEQPEKTITVKEGEGVCVKCLVRATCKEICPEFSLDQAVNNGELGYFRGMKFCEKNNKNFVIKTDNIMESILFTPHYYAFGYLKSDKPEVDRILAERAKAEGKEVEAPKQLADPDSA